MATQPKIVVDREEQIGTAELDVTDTVETVKKEESTIRNNLKLFRRYIENHVKVDDLIGHFGVFTKAQQEQFLRIDAQNPIEATKLAFDAIDEISGITGKYTRLVSALNAAGYPKIVKILTGQIIPVNDNNQKKIQASFSHIYDRLQTDAVLPYLYQWEVIGVGDVEKIKSVAKMDSTQNATLKLLLALPNRSRNWYGYFMRALLESGQADLAEIVDRDLAERLTNETHKKETSPRQSMGRDSELSTEEVPQEDERELNPSETQITSNQADTDFVIGTQNAQNQISHVDPEEDTSGFLEMIKQVYETIKVIVQNIGSANKSMLQGIVKAVNVKKMVTSLSNLVPDLSAVKQVVQTMPAKDIDKKLKRNAKLIANPCKPKKVLIGSKAIQLSSLSVRSPSDESLSQITGSAFMPGGEFVTCDANNKKIKVFDRDLAHQSDLELSGSPWDIAVLDDQICVVTLPVEKKLQFVNVCPSTEILVSKDMETMCHGIAAADNKLFVTCYDPQTKNANGEIRVLDILGNMLSKIDCAKLELVHPCSIELSNTGDRIYVADFLKSTLKCSTKYGELIYQHTDDAMKNPTTIFLDGEDNAFVCGRWSHNVTAVMANGEGQGTLLNREDGLNHPLSISFRDSDGLLAVSLTDQSEILMFKLQA